MKAAALYADTIHVAALDLLVDVADNEPRAPSAPATKFSNSDPRYVNYEIAKSVAVLLRDGISEERPFPLSAGAQHRVESLRRELCLAVDAGVLLPPVGLINRGIARETFALRVVDEQWEFEPEVEEPKEWQGAIAAALISQLDAFPDASMDVILDIRGRLEVPRVYFRAAIAEVAQELMAADLAPRELAPVLADIRVRVVDPALDHIRSELDALGARRTLLRVAKNRIALTSAIATFAIVAGGGSVDQLLQGATAASLVSAAAAEIDYRDTVASRLQLQPYWLLHAADRRMRATSRHS